MFRSTLLCDCDSNTPLQRFTYLLLDRHSEKSEKDEPSEHFYRIPIIGSYRVIMVSSQID